jgi:trimethylamine---corrinoid protein Co-methyltransferase
MGRLLEPVRYLDQEEMERIHRAALRILEEVGMQVESPEAMGYFERFGCRVDYDHRRVRFPGELVQTAVDRMRQANANPARIPQRMSVRYSQIYFTTMPHRIHRDFSASAGGFNMHILDLDGRRRLATMEDVRAAIRLADALGNINFMGLPVSAQEISPVMRPVVMAAELVKNTRKLGGVETFDRLDVHFIARIAEVVAGGAAELRRNPVLVGYGEARSPLCLDANMAEILIDYVKLGLPQSLDTMPAGGTTAPMTAAGVLAQGVAETLSGLVLGYAVDPEAIISIDVLPTKADMQTGGYAYASPERVVVQAANMQMMSEYYGCPSGTHGGRTDSTYPGYQAGMEKAFSMLMPILCGSVGIGTLGALENCMIFSPQQLVIDNDLVGSVRCLLNGFEVSDETLGVDVIKEIGPSGSFMAHEHTLRHLRDEKDPSKLYSRLAWTAANASSTLKLEEKAKQTAATLMQRETQRPLTGDQERAIDEIVVEAWAKRKELRQL